jgi:hypothetical protein
MILVEFSRDNLHIMVNVGACTLTLESAVVGLTMGISEPLKLDLGCLSNLANSILS